MSHEIRTSINAVISRNSDDIEKKDYSFDKISDAYNHLLGVINDILDMSKTEADKLELSEINFNLRDMLRHITGIMRVKTDEKQQEFSVIIDELIPAHLVGDDQRLAQVIPICFRMRRSSRPKEGE